MTFERDLVELNIIHMLEHNENKYYKNIFKI